MILELILAGMLGGVLVFKDVTWRTWEFWVVMFIYNFAIANAKGMLV